MARKKMVVPPYRQRPASTYVTFDFEQRTYQIDANHSVAAFTVRSRTTFSRLARLGVVAVCVEAAALDGSRGLSCPDGSNGGTR